MTNLYEEVKNLFQVSEEANEIYNGLKNTTIYGTGDILYIYRTNREAEKEFWEYVARYRGVTYNKERRKIYFPENETIYFKAINECKNKIDGYRLKEIQFREE